MIAVEWMLLRMEMNMGVFEELDMTEGMNQKSHCDHGFYMTTLSTF